MLGIYKNIVLNFSLFKTVFFTFFVLLYIKWLAVNIVQTFVQNLYVLVLEY